MLPGGHDGESRFLLGRCVLVSSHIGSLQLCPAVHGGRTGCVSRICIIGRVNAVTTVWLMLRKTLQGLPYIFINVQWLILVVLSLLAAYLACACMCCCTCILLPACAVTIKHLFIENSVVYTTDRLFYAWIDPIESNTIVFSAFQLPLQPYKWPSYMSFGTTVYHAWYHIS